MIDCKNFYNLLVKNKINFFTGIPDSILKDFCSYVFDHTCNKRSVIAANEGNAIALAAGYHLATGKMSLVYMQNSGQGNAVNPLASLTDKEIYKIPMLLLVGWRGEPGTKDEPQHIKQGKITKGIFHVLGISYEILPDNFADAKEAMKRAVNYMKRKKAPYALIVREKTFKTYQSRQKVKNLYKLSREEAIKKIVQASNDRDVLVSTTGKTSRELFEYRKTLKQGHKRDFLTVGSMGHASQIALGIALTCPQKKVYCLDGDGALIMHLGALAVIGSQKVKNFKHIILNNGAHDSVGGQPTAGFKINIPKIANACGYKVVLSAEKKVDLQKKIKYLQKSSGPALLEIKVHKGARSNLGRPTISPLENKKSFMSFLEREF